MADPISSAVIVRERELTRRTVVLLIELMLRIRARGLTNIAFPLRLASEQLRRRSGRDARVVMVSDCVHNAGPDPRSDATTLPRLDVVLDVSGEHGVSVPPAAWRST